MTMMEACPSNDLEKSALGCCLIDAGAALEVAEHVTPEMFLNDRHRQVFKAVQKLLGSGQPTDPQLVAQALGPKKLKAIGGLSYLLELMQCPTTTANSEHYALQVREGWVRRQVRALGERVAVAAADEDVDELLGDIQATLFGLATGARSNAEKIGEVAFTDWEGLYENRGSKAREGYSTGLTDLDNTLGGLQPGCLYVVAARPRMGKTSLALGIGHAVAKQGGNVLMFSMEMSKKAIARRLVCAETPLDFWCVRNRRISSEDWERSFATASRLASLPFWVDDTRDLKVLDMRAKARRLAAAEGLDLIIIDYLQLLTDKRNANTSRTEQVGQWTKAIRSMAHEMEVPVLLLSQLNRAVEARQDKVPQLSDLRESGDIEQDADAVMFIHRPEVYKRGCRPGEAELFVAKQRDGPEGKIDLYFDARYSRFRSIEKQRGFVQGRDDE